MVLDASVTMAWFLRDEYSTEADSLRRRVIADGASAPAHWRLEVANALLMAARRGRYDLASLAQDLADLAGAPIRLDHSTWIEAWGETLSLAQRHKLTAYDAAYLELARRSGLPLATFDGDLAKAARKAGVKVV